MQFIILTKPLLRQAKPGKNMLIRDPPNKPGHTVTLPPTHCTHERWNHHHWGWDSGPTVSSHRNTKAHLPCKANICLSHSWCCWQPLTSTSTRSQNWPDCKHQLWGAAQRAGHSCCFEKLSLAWSVLWWERPTALLVEGIPLQLNCRRPGGKERVGRGVGSLASCSWLSLFISEEPISNLPWVIKEINLILSTLLGVDICPPLEHLLLVDLEWRNHPLEVTLVSGRAKIICLKPGEAAALDFSGL